MSIFLLLLILCALVAVILQLERIRVLLRGGDNSKRKRQETGD
jgi:hypothetical protein